MKISLIVILASILFFACGESNESEKTQNEEEINFEKISFNTTMCFGSCPIYHLEVQSNKTIRLYSELVYNKESYEIDSTRMGYFTGTVNDSIFNRLNTELGKLDLDTLNFPEYFCCDGSIKTIIIHYDGKRKYLRSMWPPEEVTELISLLYYICKESDWEQSEEHFEIEQNK